MNTNTRKANIFITIGAITLLVHAIGFLLPWCNMNGVKVQEGLAFIAGGSWVAIALCLGFELYFAFVRWQSRKLVTVCRALSVGASIAAFVTEIVIISDIKIGEFRGRNLHLHYYTCGKYNMLHGCMRAGNKRRHGTKSVTIIKGHREVSFYCFMMRFRH